MLCSDVPWCLNIKWRRERVAGRGDGAGGTDAPCWGAVRKIERSFGSVQLSARYDFILTPKRPPKVKKKLFSKCLFSRPFSTTYLQSDWNEIFLSWKSRVKSTTYSSFKSLRFSLFLRIFQNWTHRKIPPKKGSHTRPLLPVNTFRALISKYFISVEGSTQGEDRPSVDACSL